LGQGDLAVLETYDHIEFVWQDYADLASSPHNSSILHTIQSAAFIINLDSSKPTTSVHHSRALWHGDVSNGIPVGLRNRWVDKPVQFIVFDNALAGIMGEHSVMDGTPVVRLCDDVLDMLHDRTFDHGVPITCPIPSPTPLDWDITTTITKAIREADEAAIKLIESQELGFLVTPYGKATIKKFGVSPDSWAQMIVQLAYRRLVGKEKRIGGTYEAATTRKFFKGRTEAIRVVTSESDAWVRSMDNENIEPAERKRLFVAAARKHISLAQSAGNGQGVDRHLLGNASQSVCKASLFNYCHRSQEASSRRGTSPCTFLRLCFREIKLLGSEYLSRVFKTLFGVRLGRGTSYYSLVSQIS